MHHDDFSKTLQAFLTGELSMEAAARALSRDVETHFVQFSAARAADVDDATRARLEQLRTVFERAAEISAAERLVERRAEAPRIDDWPAPENATDFCFSLEVVLSGRDQQQTYRETFRLYVCTPAWITRQVYEFGPRWVTAPLVLPRWNPQLVHRALDELVMSGGDNTWLQFVERMSRVLEREG